MLPITALPAALGALTGGDMPAAQPGEAAQGADFLALLNIQTGDIAAAAQPDAPLAAPVMPGSPAIVAAVTLPESGKGLPPALPQLPVLAETAPQDTATPKPVQAASPLALARTLLARLRPEAVDSPVKGKPQAKPPAESTDDALQPEPVQPAIAVLIPATPVIAAAPTDPAPAARTAHLAPVLPQPQAAKPVPANQPAPAALPVLTVAVNPAAAPQPQPQPPQSPQSPQQSPQQQPVTLTPISDAAPRIAANLRVVTSTKVADSEPALAAAPVDQLTPLTAPLASAALAAPAELAQPAPLTRPHEFAALVDRLVAAREALQPQTATLAVQHAQFGQVQVHFRQDELGLSVSLANADPDFARAVSAAVPPVLAASSADSASLGASTRQDQPATTAFDTSGQQRGQSSAQREDRGTRANPAPQGNRQQPQGPSSQQDQGIYA